MADSFDERAPLLQFPGQFPYEPTPAPTSSVHAPEPTPSPSPSRSEYHSHFCTLVGVPPSHLHPTAEPVPVAAPNSLYIRATRERSRQNRTYIFTATLSNTLLLSQVVLGAALTGLGASESSHVLITCFGALNTIIAGVVAYLKSRGQPMRARRYKEDLERVVADIHNAETMWLGISRDVHGYRDIDTDDKVTVRSEVARLTRLYDRAIADNGRNDPDMYIAAQGPLDGINSGLRAKVGGGGVAAAAPAAAVGAGAVGNAAGGGAGGAGEGAQGAATVGQPLPIDDPDESPATAAKTKAEMPKEAPMEAPKDTPVEAPKDTPVEAPKDAPKQAPVETPTDATEEAPKETPKDTAAETSKETSQETIPPSIPDQKATAPTPSNDPAGEASQPKGDQVESSHTPVPSDEHRDPAEGHDQDLEKGKGDSQNADLPNGVP